MGSPLSAIFSLFSGSGAKTDRRYQLSGFGDLSNVFNFALPNAEAGYTAGQETEKSALSQLSGPAKYYSDLLSGNRQAATSAVAPVASVVNAQTDAQKRALATGGTGRGGGVNAVGQQLETSKQAAIDQAINAAKGGAAAGATGVAKATSAVGQTQLDAALNLLGIGTKAAGTLSGQAGESRLTSDYLHNENVTNASTLASGVLDVLLSASGGDGGGGD
jgi:hypothetical protein